MKITRLDVHRFTAFEDASFDFGSGVNVLIGENGTGKSHVLKLLYALSEAVRRFESGEGIEPASTDDERSLDRIVAAMLAGVFKPDSLGRLVRRAPGRRSAKIDVCWEGGASLSVVLSSLGRVTARLTGDFTSLERAVFIPTREVLSIFPGFISNWLRRESEFDRTYYDLCVSLDQKPLRGPRDAQRARLLAPIEQALQARVVIENGRFYLKLPDGDMEAHLVAEGLRKLAMVAYLIVNGSLTANAFLFWDEPEASMNPKLTRLTRDIVFGLADAGVQAFLATHDYVLTSELSLTLQEDPALRGKGAAFFALGRVEGQDGIVVDRAGLLSELQHNPILDAFVSLHEREQGAFFGSGA